MRVVEVGPELVPALSTLFEERFGAPLSEALWRWKYEAIPGASRSLAVVADDGRALAHVGALGLEAERSGARSRLWQAVDWVGRPGAGLRPPLLVAGRRLLDATPGPGDLPWIYGFPSERHFDLGFKVFGYRRARTVLGWEGAIPELASRLEVEIGETCGDWVEESWTACGVDGVRRTSGYVNWRYHAHPDRYFRMYRIAGSRVDGLVVAGFVGTEARLTEVWLPAPIDAVAALGAVGADLRAAGLSTWRLWDAPRVDGSARSALGLVPRADEPMIACRNHDRDDSSCPAAAALDYAMGDYDAA